MKLQILIEISCPIPRTVSSTTKREVELPVDYRLSMKNPVLVGKLHRLSNGSDFRWLRRIFADIQAFEASLVEARDQ